MRVVIQRVKKASVIINKEKKGEISKGYVILLGIEKNDSINDIEWLCGKIARIRLFIDDKGLMNKSISEVKGNILLISQFTLFASTKKGNRPSFTAQPRGASRKNDLLFKMASCLLLSPLVKQHRLGLGLCS